MELIDKLADEDEQDDPDFELKSTDLVSDSDEDDDTLEEHDDDDEVGNSDAEEDGQVKVSSSADLVGVITGLNDVVVFIFIFFRETVRPKETIMGMATTTTATKSTTVSEFLMPHLHASIK